MPRPEWRDAAKDHYGPRRLRRNRMTGLDSRPQNPGITTINTLPDHTTLWSGQSGKNQPIGTQVLRGSPAPHSAKSARQGGQHGQIIWPAALEAGFSFPFPDYPAVQIKSGGRADSKWSHPCKAAVASISSAVSHSLSAGKMGSMACMT